MTDVLFEVRGLTRRYRKLTALHDVSFDLRRGESLGIVGESGSGKSTLLRLLLALERPDAGSAVYRGGSLRREVQVVFQDPASALDPRMRVADIILEPVRVMRIPGDHAALLGELLDAVGLPAAAARRYSHEFSGGQRQRIASPQHPYTRTLLDSIPRFRNRRAAST